MRLRELQRRVRRRLSATRPAPQLRILRAYGVSLIRRPRTALRFVLLDRETSNFTYDIANRDEIVAVLADVLGAPPGRIAAYVAEIDGDTELSRRLESRMEGRRDSNRRVLFGRRVGWYAAARWLKPRLTIETGTADGLGTAVLARALERNAAEGAPGELLSFDVEPEAGWLLDDGLRASARLVTGDVTETLPLELRDRAVDLFVHDSLHTDEHERWELALAVAHGSSGLALISDNAHVTTALSDLAATAGMAYAFAPERPVDHFYPGAGIGIAVTHERADGTRRPAS